MPYIDSNLKISLLRGSHICQADCVARGNLEFMILLHFLSAGTELQAYESLRIEPRSSC